MAQNVIITKKARKKMVQARAGAIALPKIVGMAFGSGGVDSAGNVISPSETQSTLKKSCSVSLSAATALSQKQHADTNARWENQSLPDSTSVKSDCMMPTAILFVLRPLPERERTTILK